VVECLPSKPEALVQTPILPKKIVVIIMNLCNNNSRSHIPSFSNFQDFVDISANPAGPHLQRGV
jgi:hypothetical protein